jgi:hypothetical protein
MSELKSTTAAAASSGSPSTPAKKTVATEGGRMTDQPSWMNPEVRQREAMKAQQAEHAACLGTLAMYEQVTMDEPPLQPSRPGAIYRARWKHPRQGEDFRVWINGPLTPTTDADLASYFKRQIESAIATRNSGPKWPAATGDATSQQAAN